MEDDIEIFKSCLYEKENVYKKILIDTIKYLYICIPENKKFEDYIITFDINKANELSRIKKYRVEIFKKTSDDSFIPSYDCLYIDKFSLQLQS